MSQQHHRIFELEREVQALRERLSAAEGSLSDRSGAADRVPGGDLGSSIGEAPPASGEAFRLFVERMRDGALMVTESGTVRYCNESLARIIGISKDRIIGRNLGELLAGGTAPGPQMLTGTEGCGIESRLRAHSGGMVPVNISAFPAMTVDGQSVYGLVITDLRRHEPRLRHNALLQASKDAIYALSPSLRIKTWNRGAEAIFGYAPAEIIGKSERDLCPSDQLAALDDLLRQVQERAAAVTVDAIRRRKDGTKIRVLLSMSPVRELDGRTIGYAVVAHDVTEREHAARELRDAMARTSLALDAGRMGTFEIDFTTRVCSWSDQVYAIHGLDRATFEPTLESFYQLVDPEDHSRLDDCLETARRDGAFDLELRVRHQNGMYVWLHSRGLVRFDAQGKPQTLFGVIADITERKEAERKQQLLIGELNHRVRNTLATVQAIASQTLRRAKSPEDFVPSFSERIQALSRAHTLLTRTAWQGTELNALVHEQLMLGSADRIRCDGPSVSLEPQTALQLALVLHELGTNARKYGSLSAPQGSVTVDWSIEQCSRGRGRILEIVWMERGGPPVAPPSTTGFGTLLIERSLQQSQGASSRISFDPEGVTCTISLPLSRSEAPPHRSIGTPEPQKL